MNMPVKEIIDERDEVFGGLTILFDIGATMDYVEDIVVDNQLVSRLIDAVREVKTIINEQIAEYGAIAAEFLGIVQ